MADSGIRNKEIRKMVQQLIFIQEEQKRYFAENSKIQGLWWARYGLNIIEDGLNEKI